MGRGRGEAPKSASFIFGASRAHIRRRRPLVERIRDWAEANPVEYARQVAFLDISDDSFETFLRLVEELAAAEHDDVREHRAEIVVDQVTPSGDGEVAVYYSLSPLGEEELDDDPVHAYLLSPEELRAPEILDLVTPDLEDLHRQSRIEIPS